MATLYLDLENGNDSNDGTTFANRKKTLAGASAIANPGDTVRIMASTTPNSLGVDGTFAKGSTTITLAAAQNAAIDTGESAWTASANVTCTTNTTRKQGATSASIAIASGFTTGLAAYKDFGSTNFSAYQQISFWFMQTSGTLGGFDIKLCSDAAGATPVDTFSIPAAVITNGWNRVTINLGSAMGSSIQSVAFYVTTDSGAQTYLIDNMVACKAPGTGELTHKTLIGKQKSLGAGGDDSETWYAIRAIEGTTITLDLLNSSNAGSTTNGRYWGTSETVTAYSLFPSYVPTSVATADLQWTAGGTDTQTLTISGGWNRTDMTTQTGQTWLVQSITNSAAVNFAAPYLAISKLNFALLAASVSFLCHSSTVSVCQCIHSVSINMIGTSLTYTGVVLCNSTGSIVPTGALHTGTVSVYAEASSLGVSITNLVGGTITITDESVLCLVTSNATTKLIFNGTTYGSFGDASSAEAVRTELTTELATVVKLDDTLEDDGGTYRFTTNALEQAPSGGGGGGDATEANQTVIIDAIAALNNIAASDVVTALGTGSTLTTLATQASVDTVQASVDLIGVAGSAVFKAAESFTLTTGTQSSGTYTDTTGVDGVAHQLTDTAGTLDCYYQFEIGSEGVPSNVKMIGRLNGSNDTLTVYAWDWTLSQWEQIGTRAGTGGSTNSTNNHDLRIAHVGTGGNVGKVRIRYFSNTLTSATLYVDQILISHAIIVRELSSTGNAAVASATRTELAIELAMIDENVSAPKTLDSSLDIYHADIQFNQDGANDEYTATWFKNGVRQASGITVPTLQVVKRSDGTDLIAASAMTEIGSTGSYKLNSATVTTLGETYLVLVVATIAGGSRTFSKLINRDA